MGLKTNIEWEKWGEIDPLWAVAAWEERNKDGKRPWTNEQFYELGRIDWIDFVAHWQRYGVNNKTGLEIGCGAGRLTKHMAEYFDQLYAIDVSNGMINYARSHINSSNVYFYLVNKNEIPLPDKSVTAVFSTHAFQHLDTLKDGAAYFKETSRVLVSGGTMMIHLPISAWPSGTGRLVKHIYHVGKIIERVKINLKRYIMAKGHFIPLMCMNSYPVDYLYDFLPSLGFENIEIVIFAIKSNNVPHPFVLASKI
ncbi:MAG TPA: class I SAM-dependent methyltransferase [Syntrophorhabdaceae bacterium]|nr:class I SAM-dependent methyltransferase [Syntrophorhabdaceae bacterium]